MLCHTAKRFQLIGQPVAVLLFFHLGNHHRIPEISKEASSPALTESFFRKLANRHGNQNRINSLRRKADAVMQKHHTVSLSRKADLVIQHRVIQFILPHISLNQGSIKALL